MQFHKRLIELHILSIIGGYMVLALILLTGIILAQQTARFSEVMLDNVGSLSLITGTLIELIPNVLVFTLPLAMLFGTVIGLSQMGSDSEITALRAAGLGRRVIILPVLFIALTLSSASFYLNFTIVPNSTHRIKQSILEAGLRKLESPVEPNSFYPDIPGYIVYVRDGDKNRGEWGRVFIYTDTSKDGARLITARSGRLDSSSKQTELVLSDTEAIKLPLEGSIRENQIVVEKSKQLRLLFDTGRDSIVNKLQSGKLEIDDLDWKGLRQFIANQHGGMQKDAILAFHKRLNSSLGAVVLALLGIGMGLHVKGGGRGFGILISLILAVAYYLLTLMGEQMAKAGTLPPHIAPWLPTVLIAVTASLLICVQNSRSYFFVFRVLKAAKQPKIVDDGHLQKEKPKGNRILNVPSLLDIEIARDLSVNILLVSLGLIAIFLIFTLFGVWKFIVLNNVGAPIVFRYLFFLLPMAIVQILPISVMVAALATYAIKAKKSEIIAWCAGGQSIYRLLIPGISVAFMVVAIQWIVQESIMPQANIKQDILRARIRGATTVIGQNSRQWLASESGRIYSYEFEFPGTLITPIVFDFDSENVHVETITVGQRGFWRLARGLILTRARSIHLQPVGVNFNDEVEVLNAEPIEYFKPSSDKPSHLSAADLSDYISREALAGKTDQGLIIALYRKYSATLSPLILALIAIPLALMFGRRSAMAALCAAIALGLAFLGLSEVTQNLGYYQHLPPLVAGWSSTVIFTGIGGYLLSRART